MVAIQGGATNMGGRIELRGGNSSGDIRMFAQGATSTQVERLRINSSGLVSVKTNGINLENATATDSRAYSITNAAGTTGWTFGNGVTASSHQFVIYDNTAGSARFTINASGAKGMGAFSGYTGGHTMSAGAASTADFAARFDGVGTGSSNCLQFVNGYGQVGSVTLNGANTAFNTSSDYRLKENTVTISNGIERLKKLKPIRFNWKSEPSITVDGFLAHEAQTVVPESVTGEKDATHTLYWTELDTLPEGKKIGDVKEENAILAQQIDQSKLVPLLTAALQEAITKIETLETKVAALEAA